MCVCVRVGWHEGISAITLAISDTTYLNARWSFWSGHRIVKTKFGFGSKRLCETLI